MSSLTSLTPRYNFLEDIASLPTRLDATGNLTFLSPIHDVPTLLEDPDFRNSLGCSLNENPISCVEVCGNVQHVFENWPNFYTCSWYPDILAAIESANLSSIAIDSLESKGLSRSQHGLSNSTSSSIGSCLADYCESSAACQNLDVSGTCFQGNLFGPNGSAQVLNRAGAIACLRDSVCGSIADVNPDIGGLGVILSLLIQYCISLGGIITHFIFYLRYRLIRKRIRHTQPLETLESCIKSAKRTFNHHLSSLCSALVEFQKAQCFFSSSLSIAALVVLPKYLDEVRGKDQILLRLAAANAFAPITLTLVHIEMISSRNSGYLLALSCTSFMLGSTLYWQAWPKFLGPDFNTYTGFENTPIPMMSCGNTAPFAPCFVRNPFYLYKLWPKFMGIYYSLPENIGLLVWIVSFLTLLYRVLLKLWKLSKNGERFPRWLRRGRDSCFDHWRGASAWIETFDAGRKAVTLGRRVSSKIHLTERRKELWRMLTASLNWDYTQLTLGTIALLLQTISVIQVLRYSSNMISTEMSFGQIVALGIWIPVLLEYGYLGINGTAKGMQYRLKAPLSVH